MQDVKTKEYLSEYNNIVKENENLYRGIAKQLGFSECAFWVLYALRSDDAVLTQREICNALYQPKQTVNSALKNLEAEGYIQLCHADNQRSKQVVLTEKGMQLAQNTVDRVIVAEQNALLALTEAEQNMFLTLFRKYTRAFAEQLDGLEQSRCVVREQNEMESRQRKQ